MARVINITGKTQGRLIITPPNAQNEMLVQREYRFVGDDELLDEIQLRTLTALVPGQAYRKTSKTRCPPLIPGQAAKSTRRNHYEIETAA